VIVEQAFFGTSGGAGEEDDDKVIEDNTPQSSLSLLIATDCGGGCQKGITIGLLGLSYLIQFAIDHHTLGMSLLFLGREISEFHCVWNLDSWVLE
jgi:hypothetical protein